jgi:quercetin dioxygenase-like cupin family protein
MRLRIATRLMFAGMLVLAIVAGWDLRAQTLEAHVTTVLKTNAAGMKGKEWSVVTVELEPGATDSQPVPRGIEVVYVLEGGGWLDEDGERPIALTPGVAASLDPGLSHVFKNTSQTRALRVLVVRLLEKEQPHLALANRDAHKHQEDGKHVSQEPGKQSKTSGPKPSNSLRLAF